MTGLVPLGPSNGAVPSPETGVHRSPGEPDFAALVAGLGSAGEAGPGTHESRRADFEAGVAHVFNAFGFFDQSPGARQKRDCIEGGPVIAEAGPVGDFPLPAGPREAHASEDPQLIPGTAAGSQLTESSLTDRTRIGSASQSRLQDASTTLPARAPTAGPDVAIGAGAALGSTSAIDDPAGRVEQGQAGSSKALRSAAKEPPDGSDADRLSLSLDGNKVEIIGRLSGLNKDDELKLVDALRELLERHGLELGSALFNGRVARTREGEF